MIPLHQVQPERPAQWWPLRVHHGSPCATWCIGFEDAYNHHECIRAELGIERPIYCECAVCEEEYTVHYLPASEGIAHICHPCINEEHPE